jgi:hypothetical protein
MQELKVINDKIVLFENNQEIRFKEFGMQLSTVKSMIKDFNMDERKTFSIISKVFDEELKRREKKEMSLEDKNFLSNVVSECASSINT